MDRLTFKCTDCGYPVEVEGVPAESDLVMCRGCGRKFGTFAEVKEVMIKLGKEEVNKMIGEAGLPSWITRK